MLNNIFILVWQCPNLCLVTHAKKKSTLLGSKVRCSNILLLIINKCKYFISTGITIIYIYIWSFCWSPPTVPASIVTRQRVTNQRFALDLAALRGVCRLLALSLSLSLTKTDSSYYFSITII